MTDLDLAATGAAPPSSIVTVTLKNGAGTVDVETGSIPEDAYAEIFALGLKVALERSMSKLTKEAYPDEGQRKAAILAKAEANRQDIYDGKMKIAGAKKVKASGAVMTEAMRLARNLVKDAMKANKIKISTVKASEITAKAKELLGLDPSILTTAEENLAKRAASPGIDLKSLVSNIKVDPALVAKDEARKAEAKAGKPLSKAQAGKVAPRAKARPEQRTAH